MSTESIYGVSLAVNLKSTWTFTVPVGERQSRPLFMWQPNGRRRAGKPFAAARLRRDQIVAYVRHLQETEPIKLQSLVTAAAKFYGVAEKTVWNALAADRKLGPYGIIDLGPITIAWTGPFSTVNGQLLAVESS